MEEKQGKVEKVIYSNASNGYTVALFETEDEQFTITGAFHELKQGGFYKLRGEFKVHKRYGEQFNVISYEESMPDDSEGIRAFLSSGTIRGIGPKTASAIVDMFGDKALDVIENDPDKLLKVKGIGEKTLDMIVESYMSKREFTKISFELQELGFDMSQAVNIYKLYGSASMEVVKSNPYSLVEDVYGISFRRADAIAANLGIPSDSEYRVQSGIAYVLTVFAASGSTYMPKSDLIDKTVQLLDVNAELIEDNLIRLTFEGKFQTDTIDGVPVIYMFGYYMAEQSVAAHLRRLMNTGIARFSADLDNLINLVTGPSLTGKSVLLSDEQRSAVKLALSNNVTIITGGPGTGKTTIINTIVRILEHMDKSVALAAPTGRAAKRITETSGVPAMTIHRMLEYIYSEDEDEMMFMRDEDNPLEEDVIIVDEASMIDLMLMDGLLKAIQPGTRLIIVGDADQLPSVGAGNVLRDMIKSEFIPTARLREIFRQAGESLIVVNAHMINKGEYPYFNEKDKDFFMMHRQNENDILATIKELYQGRLQNYYDFIRSGYDIQVLTPSKKGILGTVNLNVVLQEVLNPPADDKNEKKQGGRILREGDKVMQIRNNYAMEWHQDGNFKSGKGIFNGDMGMIETIDPEFGKVAVRYDDKVVVYEPEELTEIEHAFAITVHKSQGSEFPAVIMPMSWFPPMLMTRNLLYTAVTRGKQLVVIVGFEDRVKAMVDNNRIDERYTGLDERLRDIDFGNTLF